jgi:hypothetical protein
MPQRSILIFVALFFAVGVPIIYFVAKTRARASLNKLLAERFSPRACPFAEIAVPSGGRIRCTAAYDERGGAHVLVLGNWVQSRTTYQRVAGLFKAGDAAWLERVRHESGLIIATQIEGGAVAFWQGLPSRRSVLAHLEAVASPYDKNIPR